MMMEEKEYLYWLCQVPELGAVAIQKMGQLCQGFKEVYYIEESRFVQEGVLKGKQARALHEAKIKLGPCREEYHNLAGRGIRFISPLDQEYPQRLRHIYGYPMGLYVKGSLPKEARPTAAIIGARNCSGYGRQIARFMGRELAAVGIQIVSGLAAGVDGEGHRGALEAGGDTYGVLGNGINLCYPPEHFPLYEEIGSNGGLITEFPLGMAPRPPHFPMRNRIISGLSDAIIVIEARERSGSLITAQLGLDQGKEIYAVPGRLTDDLSKGCNHLIKQGANLLESPGEVAQYLGVPPDEMPVVREKSANGLAKIEKIVYSCLDLHPKTLEEIVVQTGMEVGVCINALLNLELAGYIKQTADCFYGKKL